MKLNDPGRLLIHLGSNDKGEVCVQIIMNIPLVDLIRDSLSDSDKKRKIKGERLT
jgi:hypothetical protein